MLLRVIHLIRYECRNGVITQGGRGPAHADTGPAIDHYVRSSEASIKSGLRIKNERKKHLVNFYGSFTLAGVIII